jgi:hypothetical protein
MQQVNLKSRRLILFFTTVIFTFTACSGWEIPASLPATYTGNERVIIRYEKDGQFIFRDEYVKVSLMIDSIGHVTGMVGEATFERCNVLQNRGWISRQIGIKTDFLIKGSLQGYTFPKDTFFNKEISIPFNLVNDELKGSLFMKTNGESFPIISILKLRKN